MKSLKNRCITKSPTQKRFSQSLLHHTAVLFTILSLFEYKPQLLQFQISPVHAALPQIYSDSILKCQDRLIEKASLNVVGRGGGGIVYQSKLIEQTNTNAIDDDDVVFKVSLEKSNDSIRNECAVLNHLSSRSVKGVEKCVSICDVTANDGDIYTVDIPSVPVDDLSSPRLLLPSTLQKPTTSKTKSNQRVGVVLSPYFSDKESSTAIVGSLELLPNDSNGIKIQTLATKNLIDTCVDILAAGVASSDLQYLVNSGTGEVLVIDFTEASILSSFSFAESSSPSSSLKSNSFNANYDKQLVNNFISELQSNIVVANDHTYDEWNDYLTTQLELKLKPISFYSFLFDDDGNT